MCGCKVVCVQGVQEWAEDAALRSTSVEDQRRWCVVAHSDHLTSACQEVQDPAAQRYVQSQSLELGRHYGVKCWTIIHKQHSHIGVLIFQVGESSVQSEGNSLHDLRLPGRHLGMVERTSPTAQPGKDWASCLPCLSNSTAWLHNSVRFINNYPISFGQKSWFKTLMLAYRTTTGSAPTYFHSLLRIYIPSRSLRSASERRLVVPSQRGSKSLSRTFSFTIPGCWNDLPTPIRNAGSLSIFKTKNSSLSTLLDFKKKLLFLFL